MTGGLGVIAASVLVFAATALAVALLGAALYPALRRALPALPPASQAGLLLAFASTPALAGLSLLTLALAPSLAHLLGFGTDHCHDHGHHAHFCLVHSPLWTGGGLDWLILLAAGLAVVPLAGDLLGRLWRVHGVVRTLETIRLSSPGPRAVRVVDMDGLLALTAGLIRPRIYLSARLLAVLPPADLTAVIAHEQAHRRRRDALRLLAAEVLSRLHLPRVRRRLLADLSLATERACDEEAGLARGGRLGVAETLLKVARLNAGPRIPADALLATITGADLEARVEALLQPVPVTRFRPWLPVAWGVGLLLTLGWIHADGLHHGVESALHSLFV